MQTPDWQQVIGELRARGFTLQQIGDHAGLAMTSVHDLYSGRSKEPCGWAAVKLYFLHRYHNGKKNVATPDRITATRSGDQ